MTTYWNGTDERRSTPRVVMNAQLDCRLVMKVPVKVMDLSLTGALLAADALLPPGAHGRLNTVLAPGPFAPVIEVLRRNPGRHSDVGELGVHFHGMDDRSRKHLESFLGKASA